MIVVDASVAAKWLFPDEPHADRASALLHATLREGGRIVAPPLMPSEVTNIGRRRMVRRGLLLADAERLLDRLLNIPLSILVPPGLYPRALNIASAYGLPSAYDAQYVALARMLDCNLWTDDQRLLQALGTTPSPGRWIGDYPG